LNEQHGKDYVAWHGDCVDVVRQLPPASVGFSIYSPPFSNLFCYSDSEADMGNSANDGEFFTHYGFLLAEMARVTKPGRLSAVHCSDLPLQKWKDGVIGIKDLSGDIIRAHKDAGFILHSRVTIWKDPVVEMTRTKALGLLYKQLQKDSTRSRTGMPDYLLVFRAPGENIEPVGQDAAKFPVERWQQWASPVWMDIRQTNTLNVAVARSNKDERHLCPLQLDLITRALLLWSNPGDVVLSPFMGVGSEGVMTLQHRRKFVGVELKEAYWRTACKYLAEAEAGAVDLFAAD
jgi:DNA modification methylase